MVVAEFFDMFYMATEAKQRAQMIADEPPMPLQWSTEAPAIGLHVYLGGIAEWLANKAGIPAPDWTNNPDRFSQEPIYPHRSHQALTEDDKVAYRSSALPELARRNDFANDRLHERSYRWVVGFDVSHTEQRRQIRDTTAQKDLRAVRLIQPLMDEDHGISPEEAQLRRNILAECLKDPKVRLEDALAKHGVSAEQMNVDLSPVRPTKFQNSQMQHQVKAAPLV